MAVNFPGIGTFIHIPKCAGTSITQWARGVAGSKDQQKHIKAHGAAKIWADHGRFFTVVRNPWDRAVSLYHYLGQLSTGQIPSRRQYGPYAKWKELYGSSIDEFLKALKNKERTVDVPDGLWSAWDTQCSWIEAAENPLILRYENLDQDFEAVKNMLDHHAPLTVINTSEHKDYRCHFDKDSSRLVADIWGPDIERFNYSAP